MGVIASAPGSTWSVALRSADRTATPASGCFTNFDLAAGSDKIAPSVPAPSLMASWGSSSPFGRGRFGLEYLDPAHPARVISTSPSTIPSRAATLFR